MRMLRTMGHLLRLSQKLFLMAIHHLTILLEPLRSLMWSKMRLVRLTRLSMGMAMRPKQNRHRPAIDIRVVPGGRPGSGGKLLLLSSALISASMSSDPWKVAEAITGPHGPAWMKSMKSEY